MKFEQLCRRTEDPKLAYIESILTERGIYHRRSGESFHAPILEVSSNKADEAWQVLNLQGRKDLNLPVRFGVSLDDIPDDHACFEGYEAHDFLPEDDTEASEEAEYYAELNRGYAQDRI
jgi:hypothetical protein